MTNKGTEARNTGIWGLAPAPASQEKPPVKLERYVRSDIGSSPLAPLVKAGNIFDKPNPFIALDSKTGMVAGAFLEIFDKLRARINQLEDEMEKQQTPNEDLIRNLKAANAEMRDLQKQITARLLEMYKGPVNWILENWEELHSVQSRSAVSMDVAFSTLYAHIEFFEQKFELKKAVRLELIAEAKFKLKDDNDLAWHALNQPDKLTYSSEELDSLMIKKGIVPRSLRDTFSGTGPASSSTYSGPYITGRTQRPPMLSPEQVEAEYEKGLAERESSKKTAKWSPTEIARRRAAALAAQEDVGKMVEENKDRASGIVEIPSLKAPKLPEFELSDADLIETPEPPVNTQRSPVATPPIRVFKEVTISYRTSAMSDPEPLENSENSTTDQSTNVPDEDRKTPILPPKTATQTPTKKVPVPKAAPAGVSRWGRFVAAAGALVVAATTLFGISKSDNPVEKQQTVASANSSNAVPSSTSNTTETSPSAKPVESPKPAPGPQNDQMPTQPESTPVRNFARVLNQSKSPFVQDILNKGKVRLAIQNGTIVGMFLDTFNGLSNDAQKVEMKELEKTINMGLGVYFNEHFGTEEKAAKSIASNPRLKNLYRTAKYAMEKGWTNSGLTKEKYPQEYAFAVAILNDAAELGMDESDNPDPQVQARVRGNMFQAKMPGSMLKVRKTNGEYHVILESIFKIFDGKKMTDIMAERKVAAEKAQQQKALAPAKANEPVQGQFFQNMHIINDLHTPGSLKKTADQLLMEEVDAGWDDIEEPKPQAATTLMDEIDAGWDEIALQIDRKAEEKVAFEKTQIVEFDLPLEMTTREENQAMLQRTIEKVVELYPQADGEKIRRMMKQYGWIGMKSVSREKSHIKMQIHPNFYKILKVILSEKKKTAVMLNS